MSPEYSTKFSLVFQGEKKSETIIKFQYIWDDEIQKKINSFRNDDERMRRNLMDRSTNMVS